MDTDIGGPRRAFPTTRISVIRALESPDEEARRAAFGALVAVYWKPVYTHLIMRWGQDGEAAKDLTQEFFAEAMPAGTLGTYDPARARFRTFIRGCVDHFVANALRAERRLKRGGGSAPVALDTPGAEAEMAKAGQVTDAEADAKFHQEWVRAIFTGAVEALRTDCATGDRAIRFRLFEQYDLVPADSGAQPTYRALADEFAIPVTQVTNHLAWARREFRARVLAQLRLLAGSEAEFRADARELLGLDPE